MSLQSSPQIPTKNKPSFNDLEMYKEAKIDVAKRRFGVLIDTFVKVTYEIFCDYRKFAN